MKKILVPVLLYVLAVAWLLFMARPVDAQLLITEVMPDPAASQDSSEWVEIYNYTPFDLPLAEIKVNDKALTSAQQILPANTYLVVTKNVATFISEFGEVANVASSPISLVNSGGSVQVKYEDSLIDSLSYPSTVSNKSVQRDGPLCSLSAWTLFSPGLPDHAEDNENCWPAQVTQLFEDIEIEHNLQDNTNNFVLPDADKIFGWKIAAGEQDEYYLGSAVSNFLIEDDVTVYTYNEHQAKIYTAKEAMFLPELQFIPEINYENKIAQIKLITAGIKQPKLLAALEIDIAGNKLIFNDYLILPGENILKIIPVVQLHCAIDCKQQYIVTVNSKEWGSGEFNIPDISVSSSSSASSNSSSSSSTTSSQPMTLNTVEISEVFAAPASGQSEWVEIYNYGSTEIDLVGWYLQDNRGKHNLSGIIKSNEFKVINDLKISLNNTGELIELFNSQNQPIDSWQQPEVSNSQTAIRLLDNQRHRVEILISESSSPGRENELVRQSVSSSSTSKSSVSKTSTSANTVLNKSTTQLKEDMQLLLPNLDILDFSNTGEPAKPIDTSIQQLVLLLITVIQVVLVIKTISRMQVTKDCFTTTKKYLFGKIFKNNKEAKRTENLQVLRY